MVTRLDGESAEILQHLAAREIRLGDEILLVSCNEDSGTFEVEVNGRSETVARSVAGSIYVSSDGA